MKITEAAEVREQAKNCCNTALKNSGLEVAVNEQNPLARGFYEHMGFRPYKRTELDEQGNPYPLLYMKRNGDPRNGTC